MTGYNLETRKESIKKAISNYKSGIYLDPPSVNEIINKILKSGRMGIQDISTFLDYRKSRTTQIMEDVSFFKSHYRELFMEVELKKMDHHLNELNIISDKIIDLTYKREHHICSWISSLKDKSWRSLDYDKDGMEGMIEVDEMIFNDLINETLRYKHVENKLVMYSMKIWENELTRAEDFIHGNSFKFLIHHFTIGFDFSKEDLHKKKVISTSLVTENHLGVYGNERGIGLVYPISYESLLLAASSDLYISEYPKDHSLINPLYHEQIDNEGYLWSNSVTCSKTITPHQIEKDNMYENIKKNLELLNSDNGSIYNEIALNNIPSNRPSAIIYITNGDKYLNETVESAKHVADRWDLPLIIIDKAVYREKKNLPSLTPKERISVVEAVNTKICSLVLEESYNLYRSFMNVIDKDTDDDYIYQLFDEARKCATVDEFNAFILHEVKRRIC